MKTYGLLFLSILFYGPCFSQAQTEADLRPFFAKYGFDGCFVLYDQSQNKYIRYNPALCDSGYLPASTFKIPHSLIALEEGLVKDTVQIIKWNGQEWPVTAWNQDQTLKTAMKYSCVWVFTGFAEKTGIDKYYKYVNAFDYGNKNLEGPPSRFWLAGQFRISANQQIEFLRKFYSYDLPVSQKSIDIVKKMIILERKDSYVLSGKTGGGLISGKNYIMWLVGYVVKDKKPFFYAMNFISDDFDRGAPARYEILQDILKHLGVTTSN